jgi:hypothetical protein
MNRSGRTNYIAFNPFPGHFRIFIGMQKVTYLLGAGASAGCIPVVNHMAKSLLSTGTRFGDIFLKTQGIRTWV